VPARITLSTRLQFLAAQTDVSGVWAAPRRTRMTVYLAGMSINICTAAICLLILGLAGPQGLTRHLLAVAVTEALLALPVQFLVFMRTDIYFVLQDLTKCANLYDDGSAYLRYLGGRVTRRSRQLDPSRDYPAPQRRAVRVYSAVLLAGTAVCLGIEFGVTLPALVTLLVRAVSEIGRNLVGTVDGAVALAILLGFQAVWGTRWWHRHKHQVRAMTRKFRHIERR
jgi:putative peptide zinc metalloprotease protein